MKITIDDRKPVEFSSEIKLSISVHTQKWEQTETAIRELLALDSEHFGPVRVEYSGMYAWVVRDFPPSPLGVQVFSPHMDPRAEPTEHPIYRLRALVATLQKEAGGAH